MKHTAVTRYIMTGSSLYWGYVVSNCHYGHSMHFFAAIMKLVREDFPDVHFEDEAFDVFRVSKSSRIEGM